MFFPHNVLTSCDVAQWSQHQTTTFRWVILTTKNYNLIFSIFQQESKLLFSSSGQPEEPAEETGFGSSRGFWAAWCGVQLWMEIQGIGKLGNTRELNDRNIKILGCSREFSFASSSFSCFLNIWLPLTHSSHVNVRNWMFGKKGF